MSKENLRQDNCMVPVVIATDGGIMAAIQGDIRRVGPLKRLIDYLARRSGHKRF